MDDSSLPVALIFLGVIAFILTIIASVWKVFVKAGQPGWASIVPVYNLIVLVKIAGKPLWWAILMVVPLVNLIVSILLYVEISKKFGKESIFALGLVFLPFVFWPILAFGDAEYQA